MIGYEERNTNAAIAEQDAVNTQTSALAVYNQKTNQTGLPLHVALAMRRTDLSRPAVLQMLNSYTDSTPMKLKDCLGKVYHVIGCTVLEHGPYKALSTGEYMPGYLTLLIKTSKFRTSKVEVAGQLRTVKKHMIIKCGAQQVIEFMLAQIAQGQIMDWTDGALPLYFSLNSNGSITCNLYTDETQSRQSTVESTVEEAFEDEESEDEEDSEDFDDDSN